MMLLFSKPPAQSFRRHPSVHGHWRLCFPFPTLPPTAWLAASLMLLASLQPALAATTIISTVPVNAAVNVSPSAPVVFNFSTAMNPTATVASFLDAQAGQNPPMISVWSAGNTVLTCTPSPQFANNHEVEWSVSGKDATGNPLTGAASGAFTTIVGVNGGSGTNAATVLSIVEYSVFDQTNAGPPIHAFNEFFAQTLLASNRTASNITLTLPSSVVTNLPEDGLRPEQFALAVYNSSFPAGNYTFQINPASLDQQDTVTLPAFGQPNAPQVSNYTAAQSVNPSQPFMLMWNTFSNVGSADWIAITIQLGAATIFEAPGYSQPGALAGSATSFTFPAGTLQANTTYLAELAFLHTTLATNSGLVNEAAVGTVTSFAITTTTAAPLLSINHAGTNVILAWPVSASGFTLESAVSLTSPSWNTNLPAPVVSNTNYVVTNGISNALQFFRLVNP